MLVTNYYFFKLETEGPVYGYICESTLVRIEQHKFKFKE